MATATRWVPIEIDKTRKLRFDPNAVADLEAHLGMGLARIFSEEQMGVRVMRALLWAGLKWEDRGLTPERAGLLLAQYIENGNSIETLSEKLFEGISAAGWIKAPKEGQEAQEPDPDPPQA